ncbi:hypothetical protein [Crenobacter intestini]|uniref:DUF3375 domain-containing protein n=1 Tax=Crenobacter intestini TaxID=2563443 RepID=A0A4T0UNK4_9NEIS|nr:hypothetical protein [Crenobacter intestini]TIC80288.1 hypothetical protein E5K04_12330 [Crenobacter intestini]
MVNPRSLIFALYSHWEVVEGLARISRDFAMFTEEQVLGLIQRVSPQDTPADRGAKLRALVNADVLQVLARCNDLQLNPYVLEFVRGLTREHELGLTAVLQARVEAIREASEGLNEGMATKDLDRVRSSANKLAELFRQISLQLDQDRHAILELAENAKAADSRVPVGRRYRQVLEAFDKYVEPMNQMMDPGAQGAFYQLLEDADRSLDLAGEQLAIQGALYTHRLQLRQVSHQAKELRRFGRQVAQQCADTLLPLRDELRQHNALSSAVSLLLGRVRKRGLRRTLRSPSCSEGVPLWRNDRPFRLQLGDEIRSVMAAARDYTPQAISFPEDEPIAATQALELIDDAALRRHLGASLPVDSLLDWLQSHYGHLQDGTLLRLFHDLQLEPAWQAEAHGSQQATDLNTVRVFHHPHRICAAS